MPDASPYRPARQPDPPPTGEPLEVDLVYRVTSCGACSFFWPGDPAQQPYGPYPSFDFASNTPDGPPEPGTTTVSFPWMQAQTAPPAFPNAAVMGGCRKAPIMTIGINPNLTAFAPGATGAGWCYPNFSSDDGTDLYAKTAFYYRYRSVYQEHLDPAFVARFLLPEPRVVAPRGGTVVSVERPTSSPSFTLKVRYDGDPVDTQIPLAGSLGGPRWVVLHDPAAQRNRFEAGDLLAAQLDVPAGEQTEIFRQQVGYYEQFVPVLTQYQEWLAAKGHPGAQLSMGEDVGQLDMVACASPHWKPDFLGGRDDSKRTIIANCVSGRGWAMRQLVQTRPAVLYLVGEATWNMFHEAFGALVERDVPLSARPADGAFTLLRETTDAAHPCTLRIAATIDGADYALATRLVVTPHFSYNANFAPQVRLSPDAWAALQADSPDGARFLQSDPRVTYVPGIKARDYSAFLLQPDAAAEFLADVAARFPAIAASVQAGYYDPHVMMADVLAALTEAGELTYAAPTAGGGSGLRRSDGSCRFCVNERWSFPLGCPYGKPDEPAPPPGLLERVAAEAIATGRPGATR